jgi:Ca2+-binding RTX toxin-like protein
VATVVTSTGPLDLSNGFPFAVTGSGQIISGSFGAGSIFVILPGGGTATYTGSFIYIGNAIADTSVVTGYQHSAPTLGYFLTGISVTAGTYFSFLDSSNPVGLRQFLLAGPDQISGSVANDVLYGDAGNDTLSGAFGADQLFGGTGNDTYDVDNVLDLVVENQDEGSDTVRSSITYSLGANVETLLLLGSVAINGTGNSFSNTIVGNASDNVIDGGLGNDTMQGGLGVDTYIVDSALDVVMEDSFGTAGDKVRSTASFVLPNNVENLDLLGTAAINGSGNTDPNFITGNSADNVLNGMSNVSGAGDTLSGGGGNDTYVVNNANDQFIESLNEGIDTIQSAITYLLPANFENLVLTGFASINATGNGLDNKLTGNSGNNTLSGGAGNDTLAGQAGNDSLIGSDGIDTADYSGGAGAVIAELWRSLVSSDGQGGVDTLAGIENLTGSAFGDILAGDDKANVLRGSAGNDGLYGGGGSDTADYGDATGGVVAELWQSQASNDGRGGADTIVGIENLTGSAFGDTLAGDDNANIFRGGAGFDALYGGGGADNADYSGAANGVVAELWQSFASNDGQGSADILVGMENLTGSAFNDILAGDGNDNVFKGGGGNDIFYGGSGIDTADYSDATSGVTINLANPLASNDGQGGGDFMFDVERIAGSVFGDVLIGDGQANMLNGNGGADVLRGGAGNDTLDGGSGIDTVDYDGAAAGVTVELWRSLASSDGQGGADTLAGIEHVIGSAFNDTLAGDRNDNAFKGGAGVDAFYGGGGIDTADYSGATAGVIVELWQSLASNDGQGGADYFASIENVIGSAFNDTLAGDNNNNVFKGGAGIDVFYGGGGNDTADYREATSGVTANLTTSSTGNDGQGGADTLVNIENLFGSASADALIGDGNANVFKGGAGNDTLNGAGGIDTVDYGDATSGVTAVLALQFASNDGQGGADSLISIENLIGSAFGDTLTGDAFSNTIEGGAGNDTLQGFDGADNFVFRSGSGVDRIVGFASGILTLGFLPDKIYLQSNLNDSGITTPVDAYAHVTTLIGNPSAVLNLGGGNSIEFVGLVVSQLSVGDFIIF